MSNADQVRVSVIEETTWGVTPSGNLTDLRLTDESLQQATETIRSREIRSDRQVTDLIRTNVNAAGDINFELSYGSQDLIFELALFASAWSAAVIAMTATSNKAVTIVKATGTVTDDSASGSFASITAGGWVRLSGFTNAANNNVFKVLSKTDNNNIVVAGAAPLVNETKAASLTVNAVIVQGAQIVNGTTARSLTIERKYTDLTNKFAVYRGMQVDRLSLDSSTGSVLTGGVSFLGKTEVSGSASVGSGYVEANTNDPMNAVDNVPAVIEGTPVVDIDNTYQINGFTAQLANNLRQRAVIGTLGPISLGSGKCEVSGSVSAYFETEARMNKYLNHTASGLAKVYKDADGNYFILELPRIKYSDGRRVAGGENTDIIADLSYTGYRHETENATIRMVRIPFDLA